MSSFTTTINSLGPACFCFVCYFIFMITRPWNYKDEVTRKGSWRILFIVYKLEICESINRNTIIIKTYIKYPIHQSSTSSSLYTSLIFSTNGNALSWLWLSERMSRTRAIDQVRLTEFRKQTINLRNTTLTSKTNVKTDDNADMDSYQRQYKNISELTLTVIIIILSVYVNV